jgi:hypothetical protein
MKRDIDPGLGHDFDGKRIQTVRFDPGRVRFDNISSQIPGPALGHLAAAGITGA